MAVYKPTQCYPYLTAVDMKVGSEPVYFTCKVNTSNKNITGYKVILLDGANNIVFSGGSKPSGADEFMEQISPLSELAEITVEPNINTGVNDTYIQIPLVQAFDEMLLLSFNCIYYHSDTETWTDCYNQEVKIKNNGTTYKWKIMLFQGTNGVIVNDTVAPYSSNYENIDASEYDLVIASGTVCGTTSQRLQIPPSDEILIQKWVQLAYQTGAGYEHVGSRGNIKSYDATLGHIYPVADWMDAKILNSNRATHCCIYKHSNNADDIPTTDIVKYGFLGSLFSGGKPHGLSTSERWEREDGTVVTTSVVFEKGDLVLLMGQDTVAGGSAKYNGVWVADSTDWGRSGNFKDWAAYLGRIIYASSILVGGNSTSSTTGRNFMSQASYGGTLYTPLMNNLSSSSSLYFTEEQPLALYPELLEDSVQYSTTSSGVPAAGLTTVDGYEVQTGDIILASTGIYQRESSSWTKIKDINPNKYYYVAQGKKKGCKTYKGWSTVSYDLCYGQLSYNSPSQTYIAQNVNLEPGQRLFFTNAEDGVLLADGTIQNYITIYSIDKDMWWVRHETLAEPLSSTDPYTYNIQTYFNTSDETAFYAYDAPSLDLNIESTASVDLVTTTVEGSTTYLASLPAYSTQLIDGQLVNNNTSALGIGTVDGQEQIGVYTASLEEIDGGGGESTIPTIDYLYSSGSTLLQMPYVVDAIQFGAEAYNSWGGIYDGFTITQEDISSAAAEEPPRYYYIAGKRHNSEPYGIYKLTGFDSDAKEFTGDCVVNFDSLSPANWNVVVYAKNGQSYGGKFVRLNGPAISSALMNIVTFTLDGISLNNVSTGSTFYGYYSGDYGNEAATRGIKKYIKTPGQYLVRNIPKSEIETWTSDNVVAGIGHMLEADLQYILYHIFFPNDYPLAESYPWWTSLTPTSNVMPYSDTGELPVASINAVSVQQGVTYRNQITRLNGRSISIINQTDTDMAFAINWTPIDSFDEKSAFYIRNGNQYGGRTVTIGTDANNDRKYIQDGLTSVGIDNIYEVTLTNKEGSFSVPVLYKGTVNTRFISLVGEYVQPQSASWMSYRWLLADHNGQVIQDTGRHFAGEMKVAFYGLMGQQIYYAVLIVEDQIGNSLMSCAEIYVDFTPEDLELNFKAQYDCNIHGVVLSVQDMGYILPYKDDVINPVSAYTPGDGSLTYRNLQNSNIMRISGSNGSMFANINGDANKNGVKYRYYFGYNETITTPDSLLLTDDDGATTFRMVTRLDANYRGQILRFAAEVPQEAGSKYLVIDIVLPDDFTSSSERTLNYDSVDLSDVTLNQKRNTMRCFIGYASTPMGENDKTLANDTLDNNLLYTCWQNSGTNGYDIYKPNIHYYRQFNATLDSNGDWSNHYTDEYVNANKIIIGNVAYRPMDNNTNSMRPVNRCCLVENPQDIERNGDSVWEDYEVDLIPEDYPVQRKEYGRVTKLTGDDPIPFTWPGDPTQPTVEPNDGNLIWTDYAEGQAPFVVVKRHPPVAFTNGGSKVQFGFDIRMRGYDNLGPLTASTSGSTTTFSDNSTKTIAITVQQIIGSTTSSNRSVAPESE